MTDYFVSLTGQDDNDGTESRPFRTIKKGISNLKPGDSLNLFAGSYVEQVLIKNLNGTENGYITIRTHGEGQATIDGSDSRFRKAKNHDWVPAFTDDPEAHEDEYVSRHTFENGDKDLMNRGAFIDRAPYTRLITYSRLEDLRAENQTFEHRVPLDDPRPGPKLVDKGKIIPFKNPWVYMGPGLFYNADTGKVHIRLSHTTNNVGGIVDYKGETDPGKLSLAISSRRMTALVVENSSFIKFENISIRYGGDDCVRLKATKNLVFDHVQILASGIGLDFKGNNTGTVISDCEIRGGIPTWYFRSDRKAGYTFVQDGKFLENNLGEKTSNSLMGGTRSEAGIEIRNCEFLDGHDLYLFGHDLQFHHNFVDNLNDESLVANGTETTNLFIFQNVFTRCLSAVSFADKHVSRYVFIYRNLYDLRRPTAGLRPKCVGDKQVFRFGQFYKDGKVEPILSLFQNTCLVFREEEHASYTYYNRTLSRNSRRSFNNIFVAVNPAAEFDKPITFLPSPSVPAATDGNCYFRIGRATSDLLIYKGYKFKDEPTRRPGTFRNLEEMKSDRFFEQSKSQYAPGYEAISIEKNPLFRRIKSNGTAARFDDLRLRSNSPAKKGGIRLPKDLKPLDPFAPSTLDPPDIGCYQSGKPPLSVGIDGRRRFPEKGGMIP